MDILTKTAWAACLIIAATAASVVFFGEAKAGPYAEIGFGNTTNLTGCSKCWDDGGGTGTFFSLGYRIYIPDQQPNLLVSVDLHWTHLSQIDKGPPFNHEKEDSVDHVGIKLRLEWE